jgi:RHS repeat-associated protein
LHRDHLGSIVAISNQTGNIIEKRHFDAWGRLTHYWNNNGQTTLPDGINTFLLLDRGYTGHEHLLSVGLIHMNGRLYDPIVHRFLQPDNFIQDPENTQSYNRYGYVWNNPFKYTDPSGELVWFAVLIGAYIGGVSANGGQFNPFKWDYNNFSTYFGMAFGAASGYMGAGLGQGIYNSALAAGYSSTGAAIFGGAVGGAVAGGLNTIGFGVINGLPGDKILGNAITASLIGGLSGAISGVISSTIGDFRGVSGSGFKNAIYEIGHSSLKGSANGLVVGGLMSAINKDYSYIWKGLIYGAAVGGSMAGLKIAFMGPIYVPDQAVYGPIEDLGQIYRRGSFLTAKGSGITLGRQLVTKLTGNVFRDVELINHETYHFKQIKMMGASKFYYRTFKEYSRFILKGRFLDVYTTEGTLEFDASAYGFYKTFRYIFNNLF